MTTRTERTAAVADRLLDACETATVIDAITSEDPEFGRDEAYEVLALITERRRNLGWRSVGRKIGFTNRTIWSRYGVDGPMWAPVWDRTVIRASGDTATLSLGSFVQPRIEPEVVFELSGPISPSADSSEVMQRVKWIAAGFEVVHCHFADWRFTLAEATADFGLHGALVIGTPLLVDDSNRTALADTLATFEATLSCNGSFVDRGVGANVLGSPALALSDLARHHPNSPLTADEIVTTGTITDAWPISPGETWTSQYGTLGIAGLTLALT